MNLEPYYDHCASAPAPGECYCHLMAGHPHAGAGDVCDVCKLEAQEADTRPFTQPPDSYPWTRARWSELHGEAA
jgi:hypothetical protein